MSNRCMELEEGTKATEHSFSSLRSVHQTHKCHWIVILTKLDEDGDEESVDGRYVSLYRKCSTVSHRWWLQCTWIALKVTEGAVKVKC